MTPYGFSARISPYARPHDIARSISLAAVKRGVKRDPKGDTVLAQINPHEAAMLIAAGGSGRVDSRGIQHFAEGGALGGGANAGNASGGGSGGGGNAGGNQGSGGYSGTHAGGPGYGSGPSGSPSGGGGQYGRGGNGSIMGGASGAYNSTSQLAARDPITSASLANQGTYNNSSGPLGWLGRAMLGLGYMDPTTMDRQALMSGATPSTSPDVGFDAPGMALGVGGMFAGVPLGAAYLAGKTLFGAPKDFGMVNVGNWGNMGGWSGPSNVGSNVGSNNGQGNRGGQWFRPQNDMWQQTPSPSRPPIMPPTPPAAIPPVVPPAGTSGLPGAIPPSMVQNPYMPWRQFMSYQNPANLGALPFATPYG